MLKIRRAKPLRTCKKAYANYRSFKEYLREDFNLRCGYCDAADHYSGGFRAYQIDHFAPKKLFPALKNEYNNLVYSCFYCNNGKSDHWPSSKSNVTVISDKGFIDPCKDEYDNHLHRDRNGNILPKTNLGKFMHRQMNMGLMRHSLLWKLDELNILHDQLEKALARIGNSHSAFDTLKDKHYKVMCEYMSYLGKYHKTL